MAMTWSIGTAISRDVPPKRALNSISSWPSWSALVASKPTLRTISLFLTYSFGTCTCSSTKTAMYGVKPLSVHQSCRARIRYGRVEVPAVAGAIGDVMLCFSLLAHHLLGRRQRLDVRGAREDPLGVLEKRDRVLRHVDAVVVEPPEERRDRHVEHREVVAQHVLVLEEDRRELGQAVADLRARLLELLVGSLHAAALEDVDVREQLLLEIEQEEPHARPRHRIARHQLRMREALVDVLVDDVRLVQDEVALD